MTTLGIVVTEMALCLLAALVMGLFFGYLYAKAKTKEYFENKIDALEELCEAKRVEASELKTRYGNMEIEITKLQEKCANDEKIIENCKEKENEMLAQLELLAEKNEKLQQNLNEMEAEQKQAKQEAFVKIDGSEVLNKIDEIAHLLKDKTKTLTHEVKQEIVEEVQEIKKELSSDSAENSNKVVTILQNIMKKLKS